MTRSAILVSIAALAGSASAQGFAVTEFYVGITGEDGTNDWFEITNTSAGVLDTGTLVWDDDAPTLASGGQLDSILLQPGESAVFLIANTLTSLEDTSAQNAAPDVVTQFTNVWGPVANIGITNGGGNLSQNGDSINFLDGLGAVILSVPFVGANVAGTATTDNVSGFALSQVGVNGAYVSNGFFNDNIGPGFGYTLIGSPGVIPTPASAALLGLAGLTAARRRR